MWVRSHVGHSCLCNYEIPAKTQESPLIWIPKSPSTSSHVFTMLHIRRANGYSTTALSDSKRKTFFISYTLYHIVTSQRAVDVFVGMQWYTRHAGEWGYPGRSTQLHMKPNSQSFILAKMLVAWRRTGTALRSQTPCAPGHPHDGTLPEWLNSDSRTQVQNCRFFYTDIQEHARPETQQGNNVQAQSQLNETVKSY